MSCLDITHNDNLIVSQYAQSDNLHNVAKKLNEVIQKEISDFFCNFEASMDIDKADLYFLDRIGDNLGYPRPSLPSGNFNYFGFDENGTNFDQNPFYYGVDSPLIPAGDDLYRKLLKCWVTKLFFDGSLSQLNYAIKTVFGNGFAIDHENLNITIVTFDTDNYLINAVKQTHVLPRNACVQYNYQVINSESGYFGFAPFGSAFNNAPFAKSK